MEEERKLVNFSLNYKGEFTFERMYKMVREWVLENGYGPDKWMEKLYLQRESPAGTEQWVWWRTQKKINNYVTYKFNIDFHTLTMKKVEIVHEGKKIKTNNGEVEIFFDIRLLVDPDDMWKNNWLLNQKWIKDWWITRYYKPELDKYEELAIVDAYRLQGILKQYLDLKGFMSEYSGELFHPVKGFE
ncbi:hypothetical protein ACFL96_13160 [Thermoproteota archaeon]